MLFLNNINLDQNELLNGVIHKSTSLTRPATPVVGQLTYDTEDFTIFSWNGTAWVSLSDQDAVLGIAGTSPINASEDPETRIVTISVDSASADGLGVIQLAGDLTGGTATAPVVSGVGFGTADATTAAQIHSAHLKSHDQNTDTGTTSTTFQIDSDATTPGPKLKAVAGNLQLRNAADADFASLRVKNLTVDGDLTQINSNEVNIGDNSILLNAEITDSSLNSDGGVEIKRLLAAVAGTGTVSSTLTAVTGSGTAFTTEAEVGGILVSGTQKRKIVAIASDTALTIDEAFDPELSDASYSLAAQANAAIYFDNSSGMWKVTDGTTDDVQTFNVARKYSVAVGNGSNTDIVVTHNLNSFDASVTIRQTASPYAQVMTDVEFTSADTLTLKFKKAPTASQYTVTVIG